MVRLRKIGIGSWRGGSHQTYDLDLDLELVRWVSFGVRYPSPNLRIGHTKWACMLSYGPVKYRW